jgi:phosphatidylglycerophosphate synthase
MAERRPIATRNTHWARSLAQAVARAGISANAVSMIGVLFSAVAGAAFLLSRGPQWRAWLVVAAAGIQLRLTCNMIDGMVAVEHGRATPTGALYNDVPDRIADTAILVTAGYAAGQGDLGWACAIVAMLTAYVRALGGALGTPQFFFGPQSKSQRMAVLTVAAVVSALLPGQEWAARLVTFALLVVLAGSIVTVIRRLRRIAQELNARGS